MKHPNSGFSLTEMLVVLSILGLMFSIAIPSFRSLTKPVPANLAREILHVAQLTRLAALKTGTAKDLIINIDDSFIQSEVYGRRVEIPRAISFSATIGTAANTTNDRGTITFFPSGGSTGGVVRLQSVGTPDIVLSVNWLTGVITLSEAVADDIR